ncbi:hypothetical protein [Acidocella facilis]|uniref:hypothetical protein n=1 Tax=Acidocella facilis TaxID=525 RepID=UPI001F449D89|nr:hypothetical protein [Acidocella facilis]
MPSIQIDVSEETAQLIDELAKRCAAANRERNDATTHGPLTAETLLALLAEDAAMAISRPGSWEGADMTSLLGAHGYQF